MFRRRRRPFRAGRHDEAGPVLQSPPQPPSGTACAAPSAAMYLDQRGDVRACCWNSLHPMGNVENDTLHDIWFGGRADELRAALAADDYSLGCHACAQMAARGNDALVFARSFDHLPVTTPLGYPSEISFAMSNTCNLQCVMCRGEWSSSIRAQREHLPPLPEVYHDRFFDELREFLPHLTSAKFLGGEPFLQRETYRIWDLMTELGLRIPCSVTTNATQWSPRVERALDAHPVSITVSLDGMSAATYESIRVGASHEAVMANVARFHEAARRHDTFFSLTWCLMPDNWHEFGDYLLLADRLDCVAGVNTVPEPRRSTSSGCRWSSSETIVATLETEERTRLRGLSRNRPVWDHQLDRLRKLVATGHEGTTVWIGAPTNGPSNGPSQGPSNGPPGPRPVAGAMAVAREMAEGWAERPIAEMSVGTDRRIVTFTSPVDALQTDSWVGRDAWDAVRAAFIADPDSVWAPVELGDVPASIACMEGSGVVSGEGTVALRAYSVDDVIDDDGTLGYRILLVQGPSPRRVVD
ncbi:MAG: radical SAM protein [Acidimicrobiales bacterium]